MTVVGVSMMRDEADVAAGVLEHLAEEVDAILVADNLSVDGTRDILRSLRLSVPLLIVDDPDPAYRQADKMSHLARVAAAEFDADWIVPFDADELWVAPDRIRTILGDAPPAITIVTARLFNHFPSAVDPAGEDPFRTIVWRQPVPAALPKVAFRWHPDARIHQGNHGVDHPEPLTTAVELEVRHFPYRSPEQMVRKARNGAAAYAATDLPPEQGAHWRSYGDLIERFGEEALHDVFRTYFWHLSPVDAGLILDPAPYRRWT